MTVARFGKTSVTLLSLSVAMLAGAVAAAAPPTTGFPIVTQTEDGQPIPRSAGLPYAPKNLPDRIVLTPGADPAREMAVAYRTDTAQAESQAQLAVSVDGQLASRGLFEKLRNDSEVHFLPALGGGH